MADKAVPYVESELYRIRHSAAHVMAEAVLEYFPEAKLAIGPPIDDGFYYDFDLGLDNRGKSRAFSEEDLEKIETRMKELLKDNAQFQPSVWPVAEALAFFAHQPYKQELIRDLVRDEGVREVGIFQFH